jgi:tRNA(Ile)-lysidine synthase
MQLDVRPGTYILGVSGGVDSMVLMHSLANMPGVNLVVAHFDHGIRKDSHLDRRHVQEQARKLGLPFIFDRAELGPNASEEMARIARYNFLHAARLAARADAIITAHHQDDLLETVLLQLLSGRKAFSLLSSHPHVQRPMLHLPKHRLVEHAKSNDIEWREDPTNRDPRYTRNYIRHFIMPKITLDQRARLINIIETTAQRNHEIENLLTLCLHMQDKAGRLDRPWFLSLPHLVAKEVMASWLRTHGLGDFNKNRIERLTVLAKTLRPGQRTDVSRGSFMLISKDHLALSILDR